MEVGIKMASNMIKTKESFKDYRKQTNKTQNNCGVVINKQK